MTHRRSKMKSASCSSSTIASTSSASFPTNSFHSVVDPRRSLTSTSLSSAQNEKLKGVGDDDDDDEILDPLQHPVEKSVASTSSSSKTLTFSPWNADATSSSSSQPPNIPIANLSLRDSPPSHQLPFSQLLHGMVSSSSNHTLPNDSGVVAVLENGNDLSHHHNHHSSPARLSGVSASSSSSSPVLTHDHPYATSPLAGIQDVAGLNRLEVG